MTDETRCNYVGSRGLMKSCVVYSSKPVSSIRVMQAMELAKLKKDGDTIYVCNSAIPHFVAEHILDKIPYRIVLVSGDSDTCCPTDQFATHEDFLAFMEHPKLIAWHAQNCVQSHPKLRAMPIGMDYHTLQQSRHEWGPQMPATEQEKQLNLIANNAAPFWERQVAAYANFQFAMTTRFAGDRRDAIVHVPSTLVYYEPDKIPREQTWIEQTKYAFVVSPQGNGIDCHRTWEALCLGCIPIVRTSPLDVLFDDLPVLIVEKWDDVSLDLLQRTVETFKQRHVGESRPFNYEKLTLEYWTKKWE